MQCWYTREYVQILHIRILWDLVVISMQSVCFHTIIVQPSIEHTHQWLCIADVLMDKHHHFFIERYVSLMTIDVASWQSLLVDSSGLTSKLSFTATRAWPRSFIIFNLTFLDRPAAKKISNWDVGSLLMIDDGFEPWETSEMGDDEWVVDDLCWSETFFTDELKMVVFNPVRPVDPISVDNGAKRSPLVLVSLSESRFMNGDVPRMQQRSMELEI